MNKVYELDLVKDWSIEVTPKGGEKIADFSLVLPEETTVNITSLPGSTKNDTSALIEQLIDQGMNPVPHVAVRGIESNSHLVDRLDAYRRLGVQEILVIGGDYPAALGPFSNTSDLIETGIFEDYGIKRLGVAGHPEGSPDISDDELQKALDRKNEFAAQSDMKVYIETQFCFDAMPIISWEKRIRLHGNQLPIRVGLAGPAKLSRLIHFGLMSGVGSSIQFLKKQASKATDLLTVRDPSRVINILVSYQQQNKDSNLAGLHFYPFGGFVETVNFASDLMSEQSVASS